MSANLPATVTHCSRCGAEITSGSRYCANCGQAVSSPQTMFAPPPPPPAPVAYPYGNMLGSGGGIGKLFSASGRIGRLEYFLTILAVWVVLIVAWLIIVAIDAAALTIVAGLGAWLLALIVSVCAGVKRLHDFNQSGWLYLLFLIPIASLIMLLILLFKDSSDGLNTYGYADSGSVRG